MKAGIRCAAIGIAMIMFLGGFTLAVSAAGGNTEVTGRFYEFDKDSHYEFHEAATSEETTAENTYGTFHISGNVVANSDAADVPSFEVTDGGLDIFYNYGDTKLNANADEWHLIDDKSKQVADMKLDSNIMKGAIILQTSRDRKNWVDVQTICNAFSDVPIRTEPIYSVTNVELINGCYYRVIVVYELRIRTEERHILFVDTSKHDSKKYAEVYEFYAYTNSGETTPVDYNQTYSLGKKVRVENSDGYYGEKTIEQDDPHYGWDLGNFFVSGYTDEVIKDDGSNVFLKNVGDKVTLWFNLAQNINSLNGDEKLSITADTEGYDQYFETPKMNFGRGTLIIRYTDHNNVKAEPTIYTNYLEANATIGADTKVQLFEEGDYEVALDYEVTSDKLINKVGHYRIFFKFSVRNGNCMVYPFDVATGSELSNSSMTDSGFRLDLAKSRYLKINLKREVMKDTADGLVEDTRFNGAAKDGAEYTDEGIYTITVSNEYTGQLTTKKIYVGTNEVLRAHMTTGLSIPEINDLVADGATISKDGTIRVATAAPATVSPTVQPTESAVQPSAQPSEQPSEQPPEAEEPDTEESESPSAPDDTMDTAPQPEEQDKSSFPLPALIAIGVVVIVAIVAGVCLVMRRKKSPDTGVESKKEGEDEQ